jgi:DNA topoisomerase-6 subunit B
MGLFEDPAAARGAASGRGKEAAALPRKTPSRKKKASQSTAEAMAARQRDISVSEFFTKNRHLLGFDNPRKALLTTVKEAVDNALDACEEAGILPDLDIVITQLAEDRFRVSVRDNGPGIVKDQIPKIFAKLLYGSKFHRLRQSRGQQGIGISAAGMYGLLTTGKPVVITSRTGQRRPAHHFEVAIDTRKNRPDVFKDDVVDWDGVNRGTQVEITLEGSYAGGRRSVDEYVELTALANPHAFISYRSPKGDETTFDRVVKELPDEPREIKPHPYGVELGVLMKILKDSGARHLKTAFQTEFSRVSSRVAQSICDIAKVRPKASPRTLEGSEVERLYRAIPKVKIQAPPTDCLVPIGEELLERALEMRLGADFVSCCTRPPSVYRGNPFQVEVGLAYGGNVPADDLAEVYRFANRVPLQYQAGACAITRSVVSTAWKSYGLQQARGALPTGPLVLIIHLVSAWVPFTSESKEAIAAYPEIQKEIRLGLQAVGRRMGRFLRKAQRIAEEKKKRAYIEQYIPQVSIALQEILGLSDRQRDRNTANLKDLLERSRKW